MNANEGNVEELEIPFFIYGRKYEKIIEMGRTKDDKKQKVVFVVVAVGLCWDDYVLRIFDENQHIDSTPEEKRCLP